jgi:hypothetical protein
VKISGLVGTIVTLPLNTVPLLLITTGNGVPATALARTGGTTKTISWRLTDFNPHAIPPIVIVTPLREIGSVNARWSEPTAVLAMIG